MKVYTTTPAMKWPPEEDEFIIKDTLSGNTEWYKMFTERDGAKHPELHRVDGPARINMDGSETWFKRGYLHRIGGPASTDACDGGQEWWIMGVEVHNYPKYQKITKCSDGEILILKLRWGRCGAT